MKRLDDPSTTRGTLILVTTSIVGACVAPLLPHHYGRGAPLAYWVVVAAFGLPALLWCLRMRRIDFDGKRFIIVGYFGRAEVPATHLVRVHRSLFSGGRYAALVLSFNPPTALGRTIRLYLGVPARSKAFQKRAAELTAIANKEPLPCPRPMPNDKQLVVSGWSESEFKKILAQFRELYDLNSAFARIENAVDGICVVTFPCDLDPETFIYLVNYVCYPENFELHDRILGVLGLSTISESFPNVPSPLVKQSAMFYVPGDDDEYDIVYARTAAGEIYELPFAGFSWKHTDQPRIPNAVRDLISRVGQNQRESGSGVIS